MTTLNEKYLRKVLPYLHGLDGGECKEKIFRNGLKGYEFPCPFCSDYQSKPKHKRKRVAYLLPHKESFSWTFFCHRKQSNECFGDGKSFHNFLMMINPTLFKQYLKEKDPAAFFRQYRDANSKKYLD